VPYLLRHFFLDSQHKKVYNYVVFLAAFGVLKGEGCAIPFSRLFIGPATAST